MISGSRYIQHILSLVFPAEPKSKTATDGIGVPKMQGKKPGQVIWRLVYMFVILSILTDLIHHILVTPDDKRPLKNLLRAIIPQDGLHWQSKYYRNLNNPKRRLRAPTPTDQNRRLS